MGKGMRVGVTGGIGSGKSYVCRLFNAMGIPVYDADAAAKKLVSTDAALKAAILQLLGPNSYTAEGHYNRAWVAQTVFQDPALLTALNNLVHPVVESDSQIWHNRHIQDGAPYTIKEAALLVESGAWQLLDVLILVTAPESLRIQRAMTRDHADEASIRARIQHQLPDAEKRKYAHFEIHNDEQHPLIPQVWHIHQCIMEAIQHNTRPTSLNLKHL